MSGFYEMKPVRLSNRSSYVKFTDEMEVAMSSHALGQKRTFRHSLDHFIGALPFQRLDACWMLPRAIQGTRFRQSHREPR